jgi:PEGA domain
MKKASVFLSCLLAASGLASAQHSAGGAASVGTATSAGSGSSSGGASSAGGSTGGGGVSSAALAAHRAMLGHARVSANTANGVFTNYLQLTPVPEFGRPRNGLPIVGTAIPRSDASPASGGVSFIEGTYNPWIYAYEGFAAARLFGVFDPFAFDYGYPLAGGTTTDATRATSEKGVLHFNVRPRDAEVYVDGARAGKADEFEGLLHRLRLDAGVHLVELRAPGYQPMTVNVRIQAGESITYRATLEKDAK